MKTMKEQIMGRCRHYEAPINHEACAAGVPYVEMKKAAGSFQAWPCFRPDLKTCERAAFPSEAEADAEVARANESMARIGKARAAIIASKKTHGSIGCPACGGECTLRFSVSSYNGHVHAACTTDGCVRWME